MGDPTKIYPTKVRQNLHSSAPELRVNLIRGIFFLEPAEWQALFCSIHQTQRPPKKPPTFKEAARWIAKLGGFLGRNSDGHPGVMVMWRGLQRLSDLVTFWRILNYSYHRST